MTNYAGNPGVPGVSANVATAIDAGLRAFMLRVFNYMAAGVGLTGVAAFLTYQFTDPELLQSPLIWVLMLAPLGLVFFISAQINTMSVEAARGWFFAYAALVGDFVVHHLPHLHGVLDHAGVLCLGGGLRRA